MEQMKMDYHLHTAHSFDGIQSMDALCADMVARGVQEICLTEHYEPGDIRDFVTEPIWDVWFSEIRAMQQKYPMLTIRAGVEIGDDKELRPQIKAFVKEHPFDFVLLSMHLVNGIDCTEIEQFYGGKTRQQSYGEYVENKAESILNWTEFDSVAHIGYCSKYSAYTGEERPLYYKDFPDVFDAIFKHIIEHDKCMEINTSTYSSLGFALPHPSLIQRYIELGGECFTFGSDSHDVARNYYEVERAKEFVRSLGGKYQAAYENHQKIIYKI